MGRVLFVLKEGQVAFWKISRGSLVRRTLSGNRWNDYTSSYWDEWSEANQVGDSVDAILLSDKPNGFGTLPEWLQDRSEPSAWTVALLGKLANDAEFKDKGLVLSQRKAKFTLVSGDPVESYLLLSSCKFTLPKSEPAKPVAKPTPSSIVGDSYNDPEALKLSVGDELKGTIVKIFNAMKRNYVKVEGLNEQICFKSIDTTKFAVGDTVSMIVTKVDEATEKVLFAVVKN